MLNYTLFFTISIYKQDCMDKIQGISMTILNYILSV